MSYLEIFFCSEQGHGIDKSLALENGLGGLHMNISVEKLKALFEAGSTKGGTSNICAH